MPFKNKLYLLVFVLVSVYSGNAQSKRHFILNASVNALLPFDKDYLIVGSATNIHGVAYQMRVNPELTYGVSVKSGFEWRIKNAQRLKLYLPLHFQFRNLTLKQKQFGYYSGGAAGVIFNGYRTLNTNLNVFCLSTGLTICLGDSTKKSTWEISSLLSANQNLYTTSKIVEEPDNCKTCKPTDTKYSYSDYELYPSLDLTITKLFQYKKCRIGPYAGISYALWVMDAGYNLSANNMNDYSLFEIGIKFKR